MTFNNRSHQHKNSNMYSETPIIHKSSSVEVIVDTQKPRSASLNNLENLGTSSENISPKAERHSGSFLTTYYSPLKGLKKKLYALKSKSNSDLASQDKKDAKNPQKTNNHDDKNSSHSLDNRSPYNSRRAGSHDSKDEMKKKRSHTEVTNYASSSSELTQTSPAHTNKTSVSRTTSSASEPQFGRERNRSTDEVLPDDAVSIESYDLQEDNISELDEVDGNYVNYEEITNHEIDRLLSKIEKTKEQLMQLQKANNENVKEYLKSTDGDPTESTKTKVNFERNNTKTNTRIQNLQNKLEKYKSDLKVLEEKGVHGPKRIIRAVQDSVRSGASSITGAVSKPLGSLNNFMKKEKKNTSNDNVYYPDRNEDDNERTYTNSLSNNSDGESSTCSNHLSIFVPNADTDTSMETEHSPRPNVLSIQVGRIDALSKENEDLRSTVDKLKEDMQNILRSLQDEQYKNEQLQNELGELYNQWNDLTELHQNEMIAMQQEYDQTLERIEQAEYRFTERSRDIEDSVAKSETRITKIELQQQQQQQLLYSVDKYFDSDNGRNLLSKLLSLVVSFSAILLLMISTVIKIAMPFASTRARVMSTTILIISVILLWKNSSVVVDVILYLAQPFYEKLTVEHAPQPS